MASKFNEHLSEIVTAPSPITGYVLGEGEYNSTKDPLSKMDTLSCTLVPSTNYRKCLNTFEYCVHIIIMFSM